LLNPPLLRAWGGFSESQNGKGRAAFPYFRGN
jgi:hypothetical protein